MAENLGAETVEFGVRYLVLSPTQLILRLLPVPTVAQGFILHQER